MDQPSLFSQSEPPRQFLRSALEIVRTVSVGQIRHVLAQGGPCEMVLLGEVSVSPKRSEPTYRLSTGETVVVTARAQVELPTGIDGVLRNLGDGRFKWLRHRRLKAFEEAVAREGWAGVARKQAREWSGQFSFRAEGERSQALRPPQVGALHAVGAHWSLFSQPATVVMPTGTGKTETMLSILAAYDPAPLLVIVPSDPLRAQIARKFTTFGLLRTLEVLAHNVPNPIVGIVSNLDGRSKTTSRAILPWFGLSI